MFLLFTRIEGCRRPFFTLVLISWSWNLLFSSIYESLETREVPSSTSSMVLALLLVRLYNFFGKGIHSFTNGSKIDKSLQTLLWSRSNRNPDSMNVIYSL